MTLLFLFFPICNFYRCFPAPATPLSTRLSKIFSISTPVLPALRRMCCASRCRQRRSKICCRPPSPWRSTPPARRAIKGASRPSGAAGRYPRISVHLRTTTAASAIRRPLCLKWPRRPHWRPSKRICSSSSVRRRLRRKASCVILLSTPWRRSPRCSWVALRRRRRRNSNVLFIRLFFPTSNCVVFFLVTI